MQPKNTNDSSARYIHINEIRRSISYVKACSTEVHVPDIEHGVATTVNTDVMIVVTVLDVHVEGAILVGGIFPVEDDSSNEDVVATTVLLLVDVNFNEEEIKAESRNRSPLVVEGLLVVVLLVVKASSWYISNAYTPPQFSRGAPWQR
jgi:hypothetical protein